MRCILRPLLFFQSIFYLVIGVALLTWSIIYGEAKFSEWNGSDLSYFAVANIVAGAIILFLGLLGFITSCTGSYSWSYTYSIIILIFIILQCIAGIVLIIFRSGVDDKMVMMLKETMGDYKTSMEKFYNKMVSGFWDFFQKKPWVLWSRFTPKLEWDSARFMQKFWRTKRDSHSRMLECFGRYVKSSQGSSDPHLCRGICHPGVWSLFLLLFGKICPSWPLWF